MKTIETKETDSLSQESCKASGYSGCSVDLKSWCDTEPSRYALQEPFTVGDHTYATDGRHLIRVKAIDIPKPKGRVPDVEDLNWPAFDSATFKTLSRGEVYVPTFQPGICLACRGKEIRCTKCDGEGYFGCDCNCDHCDYEEECSNCGGSRQIATVCPECNGVRRGAFPCVEILFDHEFYAWDMDLVWKLPNVEMAIDGTCLLFRFAEGQGMVRANAQFH